MVPVAVGEVALSAGSWSWDFCSSGCCPSVDGRLIVPWSSRRARPEGVWRRFGRGLSWGLEGEIARGWSGMDGIMV